ncbi:MAG TPA: tetratricopeptide repeat protein, partial [Stackebrandtia sp.]|uniref:tetratricopeptide repeat protein n=1 Tax=Stackebrandtia sp. TaxID=2023065 RepID=UPI002D382035
AFPPVRARRALRELEAVHLLAQPSPGRYLTHDLTRLYAAERAASDMDESTRAAAARRLGEHYLHTAVAAVHHLAVAAQDMGFDPPAAGCVVDELPDSAAALAWCDAEHANILAAQGDAAARGEDSLVWHLAWAVAPFLLSSGRDAAEIEAWRHAERAGERLGKPGVRSMACLHIGQTLAHMGRFEAGAAEMQRALDLARHSTHPMDMVGARYAMSMVCEYRGENREALEHSREALRLARTLDHPKLLARVLNGTGWDHALCGEYDRARELCGEALEVARVFGDTDLTANILDSLGYIAFRDGDFAAARDHYRDAVEIFRVLNTHEDEPRALACLATVLDRLGDVEQARHTRHQAFALFRAQGIDEPAEQLLNQLG